MDKAEIRAWMDRWKIVNDITVEEARSQTPDERLEELDELHGFASQFSEQDDEDDPQLNEVRKRWARLKDQACER